jgi:uncharacterized protein YciI
MLWVIKCKLKPNSEAAREKAGPSHLAYMKASKDVLVLAGSTRSEDGKDVTGCLFLVNVNSRAEAQAFLDGDSYMQAGVLIDIEYTRMNKGQWNPATAESA